MVVPSPSVPGGSGAGCTMSPSGSFGSSASIQARIGRRVRAPPARCRRRCRRPGSAADSSAEHRMEERLRRCVCGCAAALADGCAACTGCGRRLGRGVGCGIRRGDGVVRRRVGRSLVGVRLARLLLPTRPRLRPTRRTQRMVRFIPISFCVTTQFKTRRRGSWLRWRAKSSSLVLDPAARRSSALPPLAANRRRKPLKISVAPQRERLRLARRGGCLGRQESTALPRPSPQRAVLRV